MAFNPFTVIKSLLIKQEGVNNPTQVEIIPGGTASTKTTIQASQTSNVVLTLPNATDTLVGRNTSDVFINKIIDADNNTIYDIANDSIKTLAAIDATKIADGSVTSTEFQYINSLTSNAQDQLDSKAPISTTVTLTGVQTLTNKSLVDANTAIVDSVDATKQIKFDAVGTTGTSTTITSSQSANRVLTLPDATDTLLAKDTQATVTNKILSDTTVSIGNVSDGTKNIKFDSSGTSLTATTIRAVQTTGRVITLPDATDTLVGKATTDTLTNKTLTSPAINSPTGLVKADVGLGNVDNTSDATKNSATVVLTNKDIDGGTASNTSRITIPKNTKANLDALTRKEGTIVYATDTDKFYADDGTNLIAVGTSAGSINLISNSDAEAGTTGWATYADAAGTRPVDGTGGSANITFTTTATAPLNGLNSFLFTKDAANRQGQGVSYDMSLPLQYRAKALTVSVPYIVNSGTFVAGTSSTDSDLIVYFYDITNSKLVEPSSFKFLSNSTTVSDSVQATVQFDSNCTSFRLIFHCASTSASAYVLKMDTISVGPANYQYGTPVTDWQSYTPTLSTVSGTITNSIPVGKYRRVGDTLQVKAAITFSAAAGTYGSLYLSLPSGLSIDTTKLSYISHTPGTDFFGDGHIIGTDASQVVITYGGAATNVAIQVVRTASGTNPVATPDAVLSQTTFNANDGLDLQFSVPIQGWSSSVQTSDQTDTRVVSTKVFKSSQTGVNPNNSTVQLTLDSTVYDKSGMFSSASGGRIIIQTPGVYKVTYGTMVSGTNVLANDYYLVLQKNGTNTGFAPYYRGIASTAFSMGFSDEIELIAGDILTIGLVGAGNNSVSTLTTYNQLTATRISGPSAISATETVAFRYTSSSGQSIPTGDTIINFNTKDYDTHGAVTVGASWKFTAPIAGKYNFSCYVQNTAQTFTAGNSFLATLYKNNGASSSRIGGQGIQVTSSQQAFVGGSGDLNLLAGDTVDLRIGHQEGTNRVLQNIDSLVHFEGKKVGN